MEVPLAYESGCASKLTGSATVTCVAATRASAVLRWGSLEEFEMEVTRRKEKAQDSYDARCEAAAAAARAAAATARAAAAEAAAAASAGGSSIGSAAGAGCAGGSSSSGRKRKPKKPSKPKALRPLVNVLGERQGGFWRKSFTLYFLTLFHQTLRTISSYAGSVSNCYCCIQCVRHTDL
jgi:hypothetical protein